MDSNTLASFTCIAFVIGRKEQDSSVEAAEYRVEKSTQDWFYHPHPTDRTPQPTSRNQALHH